MGKVGVILNCHEYVQFFESAIDSIVVQKVKPDLCVMVIDNPTEAVLRAYKSYSFPGEQIVLQNGDTHGICLARNVGFHYLIEAGMDFIIPLDEDDLLDKDCVWRTHQALKICPRTSIHYWDWVWFGTRQGYSRAPEWKAEELFAHPFMSSCSAISAKVWQDVRGVNGTGYDVGLTRRGLRWEDYLFYLEAAALGHRAERIGSSAMMRVRRHESSGTSIADATQPEWYAYAKEKLSRLYASCTYDLREIPLPPGAGGGL